MQEVKFRITSPGNPSHVARAAVILANNAPKKSGDRELVRTDIAVDLGNAEVCWTYADPPPDIPDLVRAFHADPSTANRTALWKALYNHGGMLPPCANEYQLDGVSYRPDGLGPDDYRISIGDARPERD